jgi:hypothetical protein
VGLYFSDFDPSGFAMPVILARKLQALRDLKFPGLDISVYPVALSFEQARDLNLPSTPLKETQRRADKWRARWGREQTEIDALAALRPDDLRDIAHNALTPFFDFTLAERIAAAEEEWRDDAEAALRADPRYAGARALIDTARDRLGATAEVLSQLQEAAHEVLAEVALPVFEAARTRDHRRSARAAVRQQRRLGSGDQQADRAPPPR